MTGPDQLPAEPRPRTWWEWLILAVAGIAAGIGLLMLVLAGLCTLVFLWHQETAPMALVLGLPSMAAGFGLWQLGLAVAKAIRARRRARP